MAKADIAAVLALAAALFIAIGDVMQQRSAHAVTKERVGSFTLFTRLLRDGRWWAGNLVAGAGFGLQIAALGLGSVLLVQALLVTSLLFALPINAKLGNQRISGWQWVWAVLVAVGVAVIVTVGDPQAGHARASVEIWGAVAAVMGPLLILCLVGARIMSGPASAVLLALVSGSLWGLFAVLTKGVVDQLGVGIWAMLRTPELYVWVVVVVAATAYEQSAFRAGSLTASLPTVTVAEPIVASVLGVVVLAETLNTSGVGWIVLGVAMAVMVVATAQLPRSQATAPQPDESAPGRATALA